MTPAALAIALLLLWFELRGDAAGRGHQHQPLAVGLLVVLGAASVFWAVAQAVVRDGAMTVLDQQLAWWLHRRATAPLTVIMSAVSSLAGARVMIIAGMGVTVAMAVYRLWDELAMAVLALGGGTLLNVLLKLLFHRPRPEFDHGFMSFSTAGFPSGHASRAILLYGLLAVIAGGVSRRRRWRLLAMAAAVMIATSVAFSRLYLGAHYLSDVVAGAAEGVVWLTLCLTALEARRRARAPLTSLRTAEPRDADAAMIGRRSLG